MSDEQRVETVVVTGASAGIGRAVVREFARHGARLGLLARGRDGLEGALREVEALGGEAIALSVDVADADAVERAAQVIEDRFGPIDIWINNAMVTVFSPVEAMTAAEFERVTQVTYLGQVHGTMSALKRMKPRNRGTIVQVGSALAYRSIPLQSAYCGAKAAIRGFTDSLRSELLHDESCVHLTMVHLPAHNTPQFDWGRSHMRDKPQPVPPIFQPEVAAEAIYWAAHHQEREVFLGYPTIRAVLGQEIAPAYADRYLATFGYEGQLTDEPDPPGRPDNLFEPVPGDHGAHGRFDATARPFSVEWWVARNKRALALAGLGVAGLVGVLASRR